MPADTAMGLPRMLAIAAIACLPAAAQQHAHEHGVARLDIAVDARRMSLQLESPLDNLLGFEHAPRTSAERAAAAALLQQLRDGARLFAVDPAAGCRLGSVELVSAALQVGTAPAAGPEGHADVDASYQFDCTDATRAAFVEVGLFRFARLQRLGVQVATPRGQFRRDLARPSTRIVLTK